MYSTSRVRLYPKHDVALMPRHAPSVAEINEVMVQQITPANADAIRTQRRDVSRQICSALLLGETVAVPLISVLDDRYRVMLVRVDQSFHYRIDSDTHDIVSYRMPVGSMVGYVSPSRQTFAIGTLLSVGPPAATTSAEYAPNRRRSKVRLLAAVDGTTPRYEVINRRASEHVVPVEYALLPGDVPLDEAEVLPFEYNVDYPVREYVSR